MFTMTFQIRGLSHTNYVSRALAGKRHLEFRTRTSIRVAQYFYAIYIYAHLVIRQTCPVGALGLTFAKILCVLLWGSQQGDGAGYLYRELLHILI